MGQRFVSISYASVQIVRGNIWQPNNYSWQVDETNSCNIMS